MNFLIKLFKNPVQIFMLDCINKQSKNYPEQLWQIFSPEFANNIISQTSLKFSYNKFKENLPFYIQLKEKYFCELNKAIKQAKNQSTVFSIYNNLPFIVIHDNEI
jgi:hypothetical protein